MSDFNYKKTYLIVLVIVSFIIAITIFNYSYYNYPIHSAKLLNESEYLESSRTETYLNQLWNINPTFTDPVTQWYGIIDGDNSDGEVFISSNQANYKIIGDSGFIEIDEVLNNSDWSVFRNPKQPVLPDTYSITSIGAQVYHLWDENVNQTRNTPSIHWKRNITMPVDMSDYIITSASLEVVYNATVTVSPHILGIDRNGDAGLDAYAIGDFAEFYILISDRDNSQEYQVAYNQTVNLGRDNPSTPSITDAILNSVSEQVLIDLLTAVLSTDGYNFTITMGLDIYCEDNEFGGDEDQWDSLLFKSFNLTFSYEKKIDQFTQLSWKQDLNAVNGTNVQILDATLRFKFGIDKNWTEASQNSVIRVFINDRRFDQTITLIDYVYNPELIDATAGGFDLTSKVIPYEAFTLEIQLYLAEDFGLNENYSIYIDDVFLYITYTETFSDPGEPFIFAGLFILSLAAAILLGGYAIAYQFYFKYPVPVRKVRKYRKTLTQEKEPNITVISSERSFKKIYQKELSKSSKYLKTTPGNGKILKSKMDETKPIT